MEKIRSSILKCLSVHADDDEQLISELDGIIERHGNQACTILFHVLTNLDLSPKKARKSWEAIVDHWRGLNGTLARTVSIRTAVCDYFCSINKALRNPKFIEIHLFEKKDKHSKYDGLTNLFNRNFFDEVLDRELARTRRHETELSVLFLDLDDFKVINDTYGHPAGDRVLKEVARIIMEEKRTEDVAARYGGEEMAIILPETDKMNGLVLGERIRARVEAMRLPYDEQILSLTLSGGLASFPLDGKDAAEIMRNADAALYSAKGGGKNAVALYSKNKRRYIRFDHDGDVKIEVLGRRKQEMLSGLGKNISVGGFLFESTTSLDMETEVQLTIPFNGSEPLLVLGKVVRVESFGADQYDIGVSFLKMHKNSDDEVYRCLLRQLGEGGMANATLDG